jgi:hypothetical protein
MSSFNLAVGIAAVFAVLFLYGFLQTAPDPSAALRERYLKLVRLARPEGEHQLAERLESLSRRFPGRTYRWYLNWLVKDLERAKR